MFIRFNRIIQIPFISPLSVPFFCGNSPPPIDLNVHSAAVEVLPVCAPGHQPAAPVTHSVCPTRAVGQRSCREGYLPTYLPYLLSNNIYSFCSLFNPHPCAALPSGSLSISILSAISAFQCIHKLFISSSPRFMRFRRSSPFLLEYSLVVFLLAMVICFGFQLDLSRQPAQLSFFFSES